ncbi:MAG: type IV secretory system conjugative DNA transfer family protein, partial [Gammaproteobacteria bacterium]|nr:type IV secretory system conjugative DNA transfer family protein [Gammaproteobacteria bacterium]
NDPVMAQALDALYRRAAKHGGAMWLVIQGIADLYNSAHGETIYNNSAHKFIMSQRPEAIDSIIKTGKLKIEPYGAEVMKSVHTVKGKYAEFMLMRSPTDWGVMRHMMDRFSYVLTSSQGAEREVVLAAINSGRPVQEVIDQFLADHPD